MAQDSTRSMVPHIEDAAQNTTVQGANDLGLLLPHPSLQLWQQLRPMLLSPQLRPSGQELLLAQSTSTPRTADALQSSAGTDAAKAAADAPPVPEQVKLQAARDRLTDAAQSVISDRKQLDRFKSDMATLESRAGSQGLAPSEVIATYENVGRLLDISSSAQIAQPERVRAAEQVMRNAATPTKIDQGFHDTCNVTTVEVRTYMRTPSAAAKLVADVATTGSYTTSDGSKISITADSLKPDDESSQNNSPDRLRNYASQIFQITAVNVFWQRAVNDPFGNFAGKGNLRFEQFNNKRSTFLRDTGERLLATYTHPPKELAHGPALGASNLQEICDQISGRSEKGFVIENAIKGGADTVHVSSEKELRATIIKLQQSGGLPAIIRVHTGNEPFLSDRGGSFSRSKGVWHVVSIVSYDPASDKVKIDNQWGVHSDHTIRLRDLYQATMEPKDNLWELFHEYQFGLGKPEQQPPANEMKENELWLH